MTSIEAATAPTPMQTDAFVMKSPQEHLMIVPSSLTLRQLVENIQTVLRSGRKEENIEVIRELLARYNADLGEWRRYVFFDTGKYTRNLIATDNETFTLILLCWDKGQGSPVHDHPCDGCWVRVIQGGITETRYEYKINQGPLTQTSCQTYSEGQVSFIQDCMGLHKMQNASNDNGSITLHLYAPPFQECCRINEITGQVCRGPITFFSENGEKVEYH